MLKTKTIYCQMMKKYISDGVWQYKYHQFVSACLYFWKISIKPHCEHFLFYSQFMTRTPLKQKRTFKPKFRVRIQSSSALRYSVWVKWICMLKRKMPLLLKTHASRPFKGIPVAMKGIFKGVSRFNHVSYRVENNLIRSVKTFDCLFEGSMFCQILLTTR